MPRKRLPWLKLWSGATRHAKIAPLDDHDFRVWIELLDAASEQRIRGTFVSLKAAAAVIRRSVAEVQSLVEASLVDVDSDGSATMHDWQLWQRWYAEPGDEDELEEPPPPSNSNGTSHESHTKPTRITREKHAKNTGTALARARRPETGELRPETGDLKSSELRAKDRKTGAPVRARARAHESSGDKSTAIVELNAHSGDERPPGIDALRAMATYRLETICHEFDDDKPASSLTRVMTMLERSRLETWDLDNAIKLAEHETQKRIDDPSQRALGIPMAYFLHVLQTCLDDRVAVVA